VYRPVAPVYTWFLDRSISATQSVSWNSEGHMESVQTIKCMLFILIFNKYDYSLPCERYIDSWLVSAYVIKILLFSFFSFLGFSMMIIIYLKEE
jgi:hypothetical protein